MKEFTKEACIKINADQGGLDSLWKDIKRENTLIEQRRLTKYTEDLAEYKILT